MSASRLQQAVENNAHWCEAVGVSHGKPGEFDPGAWVNRQNTPPFYPNMVTLSSDQVEDQIDQVRRLIDAESAGTLVAGWAVKDSFHTLDLTLLGLSPLFEAEWIYRPADLPLPSPGIHDVTWRRVEKPDELAAWEAAWRGDETEEKVDSAQRIFLPSLLVDEDIVVLAGYRDETIIAGAIANCTGDIVGISNLFLNMQPSVDLRVGCIAEIASHFPGMPMVGYDSDRELTGMLALGFETLGPLRIWIRPNGK